MRYFPGANRLIQHVKPTPKTVTFRLKCEPRIVVTAPASLVHDVNGDWGIDYRNENDYPQTIVFESRIWEKEER